jgi:branched-chain amino acid aminotransferase
LQIEIPKLFTAEKLIHETLHLCQKNGCERQARVRLSVFRGNGGLFDEDKTLNYVIECWLLDEAVYNLNENGLVIDLYSGAKKNCDIFSNLKSANFLPYTMAALFAKEHKWNDCLLLNNHGTIADSTIANVFLIRDNVIMTPGLTEGCVNGVMRRYLLENLTSMKYRILEGAVSISDLESAEEVFLTNVIRGIRWVKQFRSKVYTKTRTGEIFNRVVKTISA